MKISLFIEKYFWLFFITGITSGLIFGVHNDFLFSLLRPLLMLMMVLVFLKTDLVQVLKGMKNYRQMSLIGLLIMIVIPLVLFFVVNTFNSRLAIGVLLLTSVPAAASSPALTDIVKGNTALSTSIVIATSLLSMVSVPLLFWIIKFSDISINPLSLLKDISIIIIIPMVVSQIVKRYVSKFIIEKKHAITSVNVIILSMMEFIVMGSQREEIIGSFGKVFWQIIFLYLVFIFLHVLGYIIGFKESKKERITITIATAYRNNSMALVLAANYLGPSLLILVVLSDLPWNTLLIPFRKFIQLQK